MQCLFRIFVVLLLVGSVSCKSGSGNDAPVVTDDGVLSSEELCDNSFAIDGEIFSFESVAVANVGEYLCVVGSTQAGVEHFDDFFVDAADYFYVGISPLLNEQRFDMKTETRLYTLISTLSGAMLAEVIPESHGDIKNGSCTFSYVEGVALVLVDMELADGVKFAARLRVEAELVVNENIIVRNGEEKPVRSAFYEQSEGRTYLYFTPAGVDYHADMVESALWYIYLVVDDAVCDGRSVDITKGDISFVAGLVDNMYTPLSIEISSDDLRGSVGSFSVLCNGVGEYSVVFDVEWGSETMSMVFSGVCMDATVVQQRHNEIVVDGNSRMISSAKIDRRDSEIWSLELKSKGIEFVMYMPKERFDGTISGFSSDSRIAVALDGELLNKFNGHTGTLIILFDETSMTVEAEFFNNDRVSAYYVGPVSEVI